MQVERCIELHNQILRHGWIGSGRSPDLFEANCRIWHDYNGAEATALYPDIAPDLLNFLKHARIADIPESTDFSFFYWVNNLASPGIMFSMEEEFSVQGDVAGAEDQDWGKRYVNLYTMNDFGSHRLGLIFDQQTHFSIICPTIWCLDTVFNGRTTWYPLETILEAWLDLIRKGNVDAVPEDGGKYQLEYEVDYMGQNYPWILVPYSELMLEDTLEAFNSLVGAIETRLPTTSPMDSDDIVHGLIDEGVLQSMNLPQKFAYKFLRRARRPRFQMIAPGLEIPDSSSFSMQPFWSDGPAKSPPVVLFRSKHNYVDSLRASTSEGNTPFGYPFDQISTYAAGLYFLPDPIFEDEFNLVLPFGIGANGYARKSDSSRFGEDSESKDVEAKDTFADLYRPGYPPFNVIHENRLVEVLKSWLGMVERGDWKIDQYGVAGGIDVWREADTEQGWEKYLIPLVAN